MHRQSKTRWSWLTLPVAILALGIAACGPASQPAQQAPAAADEKPQYGGTLIYGGLSAPSHLDVLVGAGTGDGRNSAVPFAASNPVELVLLPVQTYPLTFQSPLARVSVKITNKVRWNVGWQFYRYHEEFGLFSVLRNYRAHTGYTSILWAF